MNYLEPSMCEAWYAVPTNALAIGIGIRGKYDVQYLKLYYKYYSGYTKRLYGSNYYVYDGTPSAVDNHWTPDMDFLEEYRAVLIGLGFLANSNGTDKLSYSWGILK